MDADNPHMAGVIGGQAGGGGAGGNANTPMNLSPATLSRMASFLVFFVRSIAPLAFVYLIWAVKCIIDGTRSPSGIFFMLFIRTPFELLVLIEVAFFFYHSYHVARLRRTTVEPPPHDDPVHTFEAALSAIADLSSFFEGWFQGAPLSSIRRGNVTEFLAWALFSKEAGELSNGEKTQIDGMIDRIQVKIARQRGSSGGNNGDALVAFDSSNSGDDADAPLLAGGDRWSFGAGTTPGVHAMRLSLDPLAIKHRPCMFYMGVRCAQMFGEEFFRRLGYEEKTAGVLRYWYFPARLPPEEGDFPTSPQKDPLVFFHGVGIGAVGYLPFLRFLNGITHQDLIIVELPQVSLGFHTKVPTCAQVVDSFGRLCEGHGYTQVTLLGQSFGTVYAAWIVKNRADLIGRLVLVDPVCFLLAEPDVTSVFLYKPPADAFEAVFEYFIRTEIGIAWTLRRNFWWWECVLWLHEIGGGSAFPTHVFLGGADHLVPTAKVAAHLAADPTVATEIFPGIGHGEFFVSGYAIGRVLEAVAQEPAPTLLETW